MNTTGWVQHADIVNTALVKLSGDGKILLLADPYTIKIKENNITTDITPSGFTDNFWSMAINNDGNHIVFMSDGENLYVSANKGTSWTATTDYKCGNTYTHVVDVAISDSGQYILLADQNNDCAYLSSDYGTTWRILTTNITWVDGVRMSSDGSVMYIAGCGDALPLYAMIVSRDYGETWNYIISSEVFGNYFWTYFIDCSTNGQIVYISASTALSYGDQTFAVSSDYGSTWQIIDFDAMGADTRGGYISCSGDGNKVLVTGGAVNGILSESILYYSEDRGVSWTAFDFDEHLSRTDIGDNGFVMAAANVTVGADIGHLWTHDINGVDFHSNHVVLHVATAGYVKVLGYHWFDNVRIHRYTDTTPGVTLNAISIDSATLVSADIATDALAKTVEYYGLRYQQDVTLFPDAAIKPGNIRMLNSLYGKFVNGITEKLESDLTGGYLIGAKFVGQERKAS